MKKFVLLTAVLALLVSCGKSNDKGQLVGVKGKKWNPEKPYGMTLVPGGSFIMGKADDDLAGVQDAPAKTVTVRAFYMDETEITNSEYAMFVEKVRDSIIRTELAEMADIEGKTPGNGDIGEFAYKGAEEGEELTPYEQYMIDNYGNDQRKLNNDVDLIFETSEYPDVLYAEVMDGMYIPLEESYNGQRTWDVKKFKFQYTYMDIEKAARDKKLSRKDVLIREEVEIYPDTTAWH